MDFDFDFDLQDKSYEEELIEELEYREFENEILDTYANYKYNDYEF